MRIELGDLTHDDVRELLVDHLRDMHATSPPDSVHALDLAGLGDDRVVFWTARAGGVLLGCGALKEFAPGESEIKSMRTTPAARGRGVATAVLRHLLEQARRRGHRRVSLETGSEEFFAPARRLYLRHGFVECPPFADYAPDPHSLFMTRGIDRGEPGAPC